MDEKQVSRMDRCQLKAYQSPCFEAEETLNPAFKHTAKCGKLYLSVILTANIGLE